MKCIKCDHELSTCPHCRGSYCPDHGHNIGMIYNSMSPDDCKEMYEAMDESARKCCKDVLASRKQ